MREERITLGMLLTAGQIAARSGCQVPGTRPLMTCSSLPYCLLILMCLTLLSCSVENVVVEVNLGTKFSLQRIELCVEVEICYLQS